MTTSTKPAVPSTGLPPGVEAGPLGKRFLAQLIDISVPVVVGSIMAAVNAAQDDGGAVTVVSVLGSLLIAGWLLLVWWMFATRAAGPGMRVMKLQLVGLRDGRAIGWGRFLARSLLLAALTATVVGLVVMLVVLVGQRRRQGWHDLAANSVVIKERVLAPRRRPSTSASPPVAAAAPAGAAQSARPEAARPQQGRPQEGGPQGQSQQGRPGQPAQGQPAQGQPASRTRTDGSGRPPAGLEQGHRDATPVAGNGEDSPARVAESIRMTPHGSVPLSPGPHPDGRTQPGQRRANRPLDQGWAAELDDGRTIDVTGLMLLGRNPQARPGEEDAELIKVADETRTVSKTHLSLSVDASGLFVMDRGSTNGTTLTAPGRDARYCLAGEVVPVDPGSIVSFGDHWLKLEQRAEG